MNRNSMTNCGPHLNGNSGGGIVISNMQKAPLPQHQHHSQQQPSLTSTNGSCISSGTNTTSSTGSHTSNSSGSGPLENLPKKFVSNMRTLFDIMDDKRTGFVRLVDIEARWQDDGSKGLPHGVIDCLRRVTPVSGMLSFERFCAGLKICLLRNQTNDCKASRRSSTDSNSNLLNAMNNNGNSINNSNKIITSNSHIAEKKPPRPPSAPLLDLDTSLPNGHQWNSNNTAAVRPNNALPVQRTLSLPKLSPSSDGDSSSDRYVMPILPSVYAPPKPPRTALLMGNGTTNINHLDRFDKAEIRHALQNWQMGVLMNEWDAKDKRRAMAIPNGSNVNQMSRGNGDGSTNLLVQQQQQNSLPVPKHQQQQQPQQPQQHPPNRSPTLLEFQKKSTNRRREPRRHTLQNGIDYNMLKRIRHYEEEKDLLLDGLQAVEKAQEWYFKQIALVQEKMKYLGRGDTHLEQWSEAHQERLDLQRARIMEVNRYLASLAESWERGGFPLHMNLAVRNHHHHHHQQQQLQYGMVNGNGSSVGEAASPFHDVQVNRLKLQNRQLTEEVSQKSERITALELERKSMYRELLQHQQQQQQLQQQLLRKQGHIMCSNEEVIF